MSYATKFKIVNYAVPIVMMGVFGLVGLQATHNLFAQSAPTANVALSLTQSQYKVGDDIAVTASNLSNENAFVMNNCPQEPLNVSKLENGNWVPLQASAPMTKCAGEPRDYEIPANRSIRVDYGDWQSLFSQPGTYRIHANIEPTEQGPTVTFTIQ